MHLYIVRFRAKRTNIAKGPVHGNVELSVTFKDSWCWGMTAYLDKSSSTFILF